MLQRYEDIKNIRPIVFRDKNSSAFQSLHTTVGLINSSQTSPLIWSCEIRAYKNGNQYFNKTIKGSGYIFINESYLDSKGNNVACDYADIFLFIKNPEVLRRIYGFYFTYSSYIVDFEFLGSLKSLLGFGDYGLRLKNTPTTLYDLVNLKWFSCVSFSNIKTFPTQLKFLKNLEKLSISIEFTNARRDFNHHNFEVIKEFKNLRTLEIIAKANSTIDDYVFGFDPSFDYPITTFVFGGLAIHKKIDPSIANLKRLIKLDVYVVRGSVNLTYPLLNENDNLKLKSLNLAFNTLVNSSYAYPSNIEKLKALETIDNGRWVRVDGDTMFNDFFNMFYSKIYNETNSNKIGYKVSNESRTNGYFKTVQNLPAGSRFVHPSFRTHVMMSSHSYTSKLTQASKKKYKAIKDTGFKLTAFFV